tara:strand:+ start:180 stop:521 length:342 start_codon:yes stop_codon:yes gene_type:complete
MSKKFNPWQNMRIDSVNAHHSVLRPQKKEYSHRYTKRVEQDDYDSQVFLIQKVKGLQAGKQKPKYKKEKIFDTTNDGLPIKVKKISKSDKLKTAFIMCDSKKFHQIGDKIVEE